jgi:hypothetical protein
MQKDLNDVFWFGISLIKSIRYRMMAALKALAVSPGNSNGGDSWVTAHPSLTLGDAIFS